MDLPTCGSFTKNKGEIQKFKEIKDSRRIYQNKLGEVCFQHDVAFGDFKDLPWRIAYDKVLCNETFNLDKNPKFHGYPRELVSVVYKVFDNFLLVVLLKVKLCQTNN